MIVNISGKGEPVLMIHGIISDSAHFDSITPFLEDEFTVITYDRQGYNGNEPPEDGDCSIVAQTGYAYSVLRDNCIRPCTVIGDSAGGMIALQLAYDHPEAVERIILVETPIVTDEISRDLMDGWYSSLNDCVESGNPKRAVGLFSEAIGAPRGGSTSLKEIGRMYRNLTAFLNGDLKVLPFFRPDEEYYQKIGCPVTMILSSNGTETPFGRTAALCAEKYGWKTVTVEGYHDLVRTNASRAAEAIKRIINLRSRLSG